MGFINNTAASNANSLIDTLCENVGRTVTIFTQSGGISGCGFTGILSSVNCNNVMLVTAPTPAPTYPFGCSRCCRPNNWTNSSRCGCNICGSICVIPIDKIVSCLFCTV